LALVALTFCVCCSPALAASVNDNRAAALGLPSDEQFQINTSGNTLEASEPNTVNGGCQESVGQPRVGATAWYRVTGSGGPITLTTAEADSANAANVTAVDTVLFVYPKGSNQAVACNDDAPGVVGPSQVTFASTAGQEYEVQVGTCCDQSKAGGTIFFSVRPYNDPQGAPTVVAPGATVAASNFFGTTEPNELAECFDPLIGFNVGYTRTVWFAFDAPAAGQAIFRAAGPADTVATIYRDGAHLACDNDTAGRSGPSAISTHITPGRYLIQVGTAFGRRGKFDFSVDFFADPVPPPSIDADGDGYVGSSHGGPDCDDGDAKIKPGALEIVGNKIDENCDRLAPEAAPRAGGLVHSAFLVGKPGTSVTKLTVSGAQVGATVTVSCTAKTGCPFKLKSFPVKSTAMLKLTSAFAGTKLKPGTEIQIKIGYPDSIATVTRFSIRKGKQPTRKSLCLPPGETSPKAC
jgi:hypothetical protein